MGPRGFAGLKLNRNRFPDATMALSFRTRNIVFRKGFPVRCLEKNYNP
jgi:hypothetical protein